MAVLKRIAEGLLFVAVMAVVFSIFFVLTSLLIYGQVNW
jgi:hypothetical protein